MQERSRATQIKPVGPQLAHPCSIAYLGPMKRKTRESQQRIRLINMMGEHMMNHDVKSTPLFGVYNLHINNKLSTIYTIYTVSQKKRTNYETV